MRLILFTAVVIFSAGCTSSKRSASEENKLNGTWIPVKEEVGGTLLPPAAFAKQKLVISDSNYTVYAESVDKGVVVYKHGKMDIYGRDGVNKGHHFATIYKLEAGQLTVCYNLKGGGYPEEFDTKGKPAFFVAVYKRE